MSHHHSFNTQPRKRMRQKDALMRWKWRLSKKGQLSNKLTDEQERSFCSAAIEICKQQIAFIEAKGITA